MNLLEKDLKLLLDTLADRCTTETMRSVMDTMKQSMDDGEIPPTETVRSFIQHPEQPTDLTAFQQALAMDNLLEQAEVNFRTLCDLLRYPSIPKVPNMADRIPSRNAGTAMSNLFCGGLHGQMWQTAIWSAPDMRNASTTAAMPSVVCWSGPRSMRVWLPEPWKKRVSSLTGAS